MQNGIVDVQNNGKEKKSVLHVQICFFIAN